MGSFVEYSVHEQAGIYKLELLFKDLDILG